MLSLDFVGCRLKLYSYELHDRDFLKEHEKEHGISKSLIENIFWYIQPPSHIFVPRSPFPTP